MEVKAWAKLNLTLDILRRRADGYHDLEMVMQAVSLHDTLTLTPGGEGLRVSTDLDYLPDDESNLAARAARRFFRARPELEVGLDIAITKRIPVCAGLGGGSSDGAAVLRGLNELTGAGLSVTELAALGADVGSDVPFCVLGGTALARGRGEQLTPLPPLPPCHVVICKPPFPISTPELFGRVDCRRIARRPDTAGVAAALEAGDLAGVARRMYNVFEDVLPPRKKAAVDQIKTELIAAGALGAIMSGSGPTVFGLFDRPDLAREAARRLGEEYRDTFLAEIPRKV